MAQEQKDIEVRMLDRSVRYGVATGNNAAWLCVCGREKPLIGRSYQPISKDPPSPKQVVQCPNCNKIYQISPENGNYQGRVDYVQERECYL